MIDTQGKKPGFMYRIARSVSAGLVAAVGLFNFTPFMHYVSRAGGGNAQECQTVDEVLARDSHKDLAETIQDVPAARDIFSFASATRQQICVTKVGDGREAEYSSAFGKTLVGDFDHPSFPPRTYGKLTTLAHEFYHAFQESIAPVETEKLYRRYDLHSNNLASVYTEAAAYAFETLVAYEYFQKHPGQKKSAVEFTFAGEMLDVFEAEMRRLSGKGDLNETERKNFAARKVFEHFLTSNIVEATFAFTGQGDRFDARNDAWHKSPQRIFAFKRATAAELQGTTTLPNGFNLYRFDRLPTEKEVKPNHFLPRF